MSETTLLSRLVTVFQADTDPPNGLVELTGHSVSDKKILRAEPPTKDKTPFVGIKVINTRPLIEESAATKIKVSIVRASCSATSESEVIKIADRLESLLHPTENNGFLDFTGGGIITKSTVFLSRVEREHNEDADQYVENILFSVIWNEGTCP